MLMRSTRSYGHLDDSFSMFFPGAISSTAPCSSRNKAKH